ncbi:TIGR01244 family phosphatase [Ramlibacter sp. AW1]|uniref:TIGR01244 family phosphatase n=1 Tax=Ramlibacter aurantiacus TaxID=2801330 RepID=A0A936ZQ99_9BURK|nr:TIGR01244 family sulfur transferase [Ramlibacter aurantiacus]MBL0419025.1 TIGR01244 family phosphatase [Ramlibacter aurantiacus]
MTDSLRCERIDDDLAITGQLVPQALAAVAAAGFRAVINNRPDHEGGAAQPTSDEIEQAARAAGLDYRWVPVPPSGHTLQQAQAMARAVAELPKPVLAFCRTGRRSAALHRLGQDRS